ncbi:MAG: PAS domain S-box protein, partial [Armatimonadota bacterium]
QEFFPIENPAGVPYADAWRASRLPEDRERVRRTGADALRAGKSGYTNEFRCRRADGAVRWIKEDVRVLYREPGAWRVVGICTDITELKEAVERQQALVQSLKALFSIAYQLMGCPDVDCICRCAVDLSRELLGLERCSIFLEENGELRGTYGTDMRGRTVSERDARVPSRPIWERISREAEGEGQRWMVFHGPWSEWNGEKFVNVGEGWVAVTEIIGRASNRIGLFFNDAAITNTPVDPVKQDVVLVLCSVLGSVIEMKRAEDELKRFVQLLETRVSERTAELQMVNEKLREEVAERQRVQETLRRVLANARARVWHADLAKEGGEFRVVASREVSIEAAKALVPIEVPEGWTFSEALERRIPDEDRRRISETVLDALNTGKPGYSVEFRVVSEDGRVFWLSEDVNIQRLEENRWRLVGVCTDITERRAAQEQLVFLSRALSCAGDAVIVTDQQGVVQYVNPAFERMSGYNSREVVGHPWYTLPCVPFGEEAWSRVGSLLNTGESWQGRLECFRKDGSAYQTSIVVSPVVGLGGRVTGYVVVNRDITEQAKLEDQLRETQKMEAIGRLAGGVAHDFNNLLQAVNIYSQMIVERPATLEKIREWASQISRAGERAASLTRQLLAFGRQQILEPKVFNPNDRVADLEKLLRRTIGEDIELVVVLDPNLWNVKADPVQFDQVVMNLVLNARDAMPSGGKLTIETANTELGVEYTRTHPDSAPGRYVVVAVADTGIGMDEATKSHIFEPFFTTKELGRGTGLGLSTVYGIVQQSGGMIHVYSEPGKGSCFKVYLPAFEGDALAVEEQSAEQSASLVSATVLLVEDDSVARAAAA